MPICAPCQPVHTAEDCEDVVHGRDGVQRRCYCQHKPRTAAAGGQPTPGPECQIPTEVGER